MRRVAEAAAAAAADSPLVASAFVNHVGSRDGMSGRYDIEPVREAAATVLAHHIAVRAARRPRARADSRPAGCRRGADRRRGPRRSRLVGALFDAAALDVVTAPRRRLGRRDGDPAGRHGRATSGRRPRPARERIAGGEIADPDRFLREALADAARLEAHIVGHVGHRAEAMGRSRRRRHQVLDRRRVGGTRHPRRGRPRRAPRSGGGGDDGRASPATRPPRRVTPRPTPTRRPTG